MLDLGFVKTTDQQYVLDAVGTCLKKWDFQNRDFQKWELDVRKGLHRDFGTNHESTILSLEVTQGNAMKVTAEEGHELTEEEYGLTVLSGLLTSASQRSLHAASLLKVVNEAEIEVEAEAV